MVNKNLLTYLLNLFMNDLPMLWCESFSQLFVMEIKKRFFIELSESIPIVTSISPLIFTIFPVNLNGLEMEYSLPSIGLAANKFTVNHQIVPRNLRYCSPYGTFNFAFTISHSLIFCFQLLFYLLVLAFIIWECDCVMVSNSKFWRWR